MGAPPTDLFSESGIGFLIIELGILGPILWVALGWQPDIRILQVSVEAEGYMGISNWLRVLWYALILLFPITWGGIDPYENFINNAYLWLLVGVLFRLPTLVEQAQLDSQIEASSASPEIAPRFGLPTVRVPAQAGRRR